MSWRKPGGLGAILNVELLGGSYESTYQHLATLEGAPVDEWRAEPNITVDELFRQLTTLAEGTSQACSYHSQES